MRKQERKKRDAARLELERKKLESQRAKAEIWDD